MKDEFLDINKETYDKSVGFAEKSLKDPQNYERVIEYLAKYMSGNEIVLELGPGNGYILKLLSLGGHKVTGIELSKERTELVRKTAPGANIINDDFLIYDFKEQKYDLIIALMFIHLFPLEQFEKIMTKIYQLLNNNGLFAVSTTINKESLEGYSKRLDGFVRYRRKFSKEELEEILKNYHFEILDFFETTSSSGEIIMNYICRK